MSYDQTVSEHYTHGGLLGAIEASLAELGKSLDCVTIEDLAPVDEFHIGGRLATDHLLDQVSFSENHHVLDVGCGLGGASRFIANKCNRRVSGIDLTQEYIEVGKALCEWVGMGNKIALYQGSALSMPFENEAFDGALMLHVGMNIEDKTRLFTEVHRVLRPGARFAVYDVMRIKDGELSYPVPWATEKETSYLAGADQYRKTLEQAGFKVGEKNVRHEFALEFFAQMREKTEGNGGPPPLGLHTLMQESTAIKVKNMIANITAGLIAPVELIAQKD